jgi:predicted ATP-dependent endonuclease of OLD family
MKLIKAQITNYRCVDDSGEFTLHQTTCLVGKNESGKTTLLRAIEKLNPLGESTAAYDETRDYPRRFLTDYAERHPNSEAQVARSVWKLEQPEIDALQKEFGPDCLASDEVVVTKHYKQTQNSWSVSVKTGASLEYLAKAAGVTGDTLKGAKPHLQSEAAFIAFFNGIEGEKPPSLKALHDKIVGYRKSDIGYKAIDLLQPFWPEFFYVSSYDRMPGKVSVQDLVTKKGQNRTTDEEDIFLDFLAYAGTNIEQFQNPQQFESLRARVEAASIKISRQIFEYWSQNKSLKVQLSIDQGRPGDPAPFNTGDVIHARIYNSLHEMTVPFDERSAGFTWFFSFLVKFSQVKQHHGKLIILLDEPGLNLHAKAQSDLLRYIREKLEPHHQVIYTTHSPFMVPADDLASVRTVEDVVVRKGEDELEILGTKVGDQVLSTDRDTLFPLQNALGYELTQTLFVGSNTLLLEGPSDILYLQTMSSALTAMKRTGMSSNWTLCPAGGVDKVASFVALFGGNKLNVAVLTDFANGQKRKIEDLKRSAAIRDGSRVLLATDFVDLAEADIEDMFGRKPYLRLVDTACSVAKNKSVEKALGADAPSRVVKDVEAHFNVKPELGNEFNHFVPAQWLLLNPGWIKENEKDLAPAFDRFESLFKKLNGFLQ